MDRGKGPFIKVKLSYSEVCVHMRVAGEEMYVRDVGHRMCQLYRFTPHYATGASGGNFVPFSFPITWGEAGLTEEMVQAEYDPPVDTRMRDLEGHGNLESR